MSAEELGFSESQFRSFEIFYPYALDKTLKAIRNSQRFVYYTSRTVLKKYSIGCRIVLGRSNAP
jgi:hypothetical protein